MNSVGKIFLYLVGAAASAVGLLILLGPVAFDLYLAVLALMVVSGVIFWMGTVTDILLQILDRLPAAERSAAALPLEPSESAAAAPPSPSTAALERPVLATDDTH